MLPSKQCLSLDICTETRGREGKRLTMHRREQTKDESKHKMIAWDVVLQDSERIERP